MCGGIPGAAVSLGEGMCMGLLLPRRWPLSYSQWWECEFITEGIIDNGESSPLLPQGTPLGFLVLGCSSVVPLLQRSAHTVLAALWEAAPLCTHGVVPASPLPHQCCPSPKEGGSLARSSGSLSGPGMQALTSLCSHCRWWFSGQPVRYFRGAVSQLKRCCCAPTLLRAHLQSGLTTRYLPVLALGGAARRSLGLLGC